MNDYFKGSISGLAQTISGHPFDTLKVLKQNNIKYNTINIINLYRGITLPIISNSFIIGSQFYLYHNYSSLAASFVSGILISTSDFYKIKKQININYKYKFEIPLGIKITILRECIALPIYFNSFYFINKKINNPFFSGGIAGILSWLIPYPIDTLKSRIQAGYSFEKSLKYGNLWRGLQFCLVRAFIVNGCGFYCANKINI